MNIFHPAPYAKVQIAPAFKSQDLSKEIVWTYLVARKFQNNQAELAKKLCGAEEKLPDNSQIWLETYLHPTRRRQEEVKYWRSRSDLSVGYLELVEDRDSQIRSNGDWISIVESKWYDDIHPNSKYPEILQLSQLIEHALLLHDNNGKFPDRVYVTLLTPQYFKEGKGPFSERNYEQKFVKYTNDLSLLKKDLELCPLTFLKHSFDILFERLDSLILRWVTFEELLDLPNLVNHQVPGKYKTNMLSWKHVLSKINMSDVYEEILADS